MKYVIGMDFGTLSARGVLIDAESGEELFEAVSEYKHGVMDRFLHTGKPLPDGYALQHPGDYIDALASVTKELIKKSALSPEAILGIGVDFTSSTVLALGKDGLPLCFDEKFADDPHAYVKLWKHHSAVSEAEEMTAVAKARGERWLDVYDGRISCEWAFPKILETLRNSPSAYDAASGFIEGGDFISYVLTGKQRRAAAFAGYKWVWNAEDGYPCDEFFAAVDPKMKGIIGEKLPREVLSVKNVAGRISKDGARLTGLSENCRVALSMIDAHATLAGLNMIRGGDLVIIVGTSACYIANSVEKQGVDGICGFVKDGVIDGLYTYEAGQSALGDTFDWFVKNSIPEEYEIEARERGIPVLTLLTEKAEALLPGESGLLALDWLNGNRSTLSDFDLSGMILGLTLKTRPEEIYRAMIEACAFGARTIVDKYEENGVKIENIRVCGGVSQKNELMMQIFANVMNRDIRVAKTTQAGARGSAVYAAVAAGIYPDLAEAANAFDLEDLKVYKPEEKSVEIYSHIYEEYKRLYNYFGRESGVMHRLKAIRRDACNKKRI